MNFILDLPVYLERASDAAGTAASRSMLYLYNSVLTLLESKSREQTQ